jgi:hypothetical protein
MMTMMVCWTLTILTLHHNLSDLRNDSITPTSLVESFLFYPYIYNIIEYNENNNKRESI